MDLRVTEIFLSIQGESSHAGRPCSFVRLTGCPMRCVWCDSAYTFYGGEKIGFDAIFTKLEEFGCRLVEITGGEPLAQKNVFPFISGVCNRGYEVLVETGGYLSTEEVDTRAKIILDVKCPASGEADKMHWPNLDQLSARDEVKFVDELEGRMLLKEVCYTVGNGGRLHAELENSPEYGLRLCCCSTILGV